MRILRLLAVLLLVAAAPAPAPYRTGVDAFHFDYVVEVPKLAPGQTARLWIPLAHGDAFQEVTRRIDAGGLAYNVTKDRDFGDEVAVVDATARDQGKRFAVAYDVKRHEKGPYPAAAGDATSPLYRRSEALVPITPRFRQLAEEATRGRKSDLERGRALYDYVLRTMKYDKSGTGWGRGDATYACDARTGNCTDFHSLFIALARSLGIPARFAVGFTIPPAGTQGPVEGYHCWAEFLADGKWIPVDISEAWKAPATTEYYFGHHPANRFELSAGRDLVVTPLPKSGPLNFLVHPLAEVDGRVVKGFQGRYAYARPH